jgi:hypothetical protein
MEGSLTPSSAPLADLCLLLGISAADLALVEGVDVFAHTFTVTSQEAMQLDFEHASAFVNQFGSDARIEFRTSDLLELTIGAGVTEEDVTNFTASVSNGTYDVAIHVDKARLATSILGSSPVGNARVFLFAESLRRTLQRGISWFEANIWIDAPMPLSIIVLDSDIDLSGDYLIIRGGQHLSNLAPSAPEPTDTRHLAAVTACRDQYIGWDTQWVRGLTPWHFSLAGSCDDSALMGLLRAQFVKLVILFTCDRARTRSEEMLPRVILAEYRGRDHVAVVSIDERSPLDYTDAEGAALLRAVDWSYEDNGTEGRPNWVSDRLPFVQTRVAQSLESVTASERLTALIGAMPHLLEGIEWNWKAFIEGKVGDYLNSVQQVEDVVSSTVGAFADRTAALATGLAQTMLAAIAVLVGSLIAAAFSTPFNAALFRLGVLTYAAYVVLFPGVIGLISSSGSLHLAREEFDARITRFKETLYPDKVTSIVGSRVTNAQKSFFRWLAFVAAAYVVVAVAVGFAAAEVPHIALRAPAAQEKRVLATIPSFSPRASASQAGESGLRYDISAATSDTYQPTDGPAAVI